MAGRIFGMIRHSEGNINCVVRERPRDSRAVVERYTGGKSFRAHLRRKPISLVTVTDGHLKLGHTVEIIGQVSGDLARTGRKSGSVGTTYTSIGTYEREGTFRPTARKVPFSL